MTTPRLNLHQDATGTPGPGYWDRIQENLEKIDDASVVSVKAFSAVGDGVADDVSAIQDAIDASSNGDVIYFPAGTYKISAPIIYKENRRYAGANPASGSSRVQATDGFAGEALFISEDYETNAVAAGEPVLFENLYIHGNRANVAGSAHGILNLNWRSMFRQLHITNIPGSAIVLTAYTKNGSELPSGQNPIAQCVRDCYISACDQYGIRIEDSSTNGSQVTDGFIGDNSISDCLSGIATLGRGGTDGGGPGWIIRGNHLWLIDEDAIRLRNPFQTHVSHNIIESFGLSATPGTYRGIALDGGSGRDCSIIGNTVVTSEPTVGSTYRLIDVTSSSTLSAQIVGNYLQAASGGAAIGIRATTTGGTEMNASVVGNVLRNVATAVQLSQGSFWLDGNSFQFATAAPTVGTWPRGAHVWKSDVAAGGTPGWVCTAAGTPGTWKEMADLDA